MFAVHSGEHNYSTTEGSGELHKLNPIRSTQSLDPPHRLNPHKTEAQCCVRNSLGFRVQELLGFASTLNPSSPCKTPPKPETLNPRRRASTKTQILKRCHHTPDPESPEGLQPELYSPINLSKPQSPSTPIGLGLESFEGSVLKSFWIYFKSLELGF